MDYTLRLKFLSRTSPSNGPRTLMPRPDNITHFSCADHIPVRCGQHAKWCCSGYKLRGYDSKNLIQESESGELCHSHYSHRLYASCDPLTSKREMQSETVQISAEQLG